MKRFERVFVTFSIITTIMLTLIACLYWVKRSLEFALDDFDDIFGLDEEKVIEPEVVEANSSDDDYYQDLHG